MKMQEIHSVRVPPYPKQFFRAGETKKLDTLTKISTCPLHALPDHLSRVIRDRLHLGSIWELILPGTTLPPAEGFRFPIFISQESTLHSLWARDLSKRARPEAGSQVAQFGPNCFSSPASPAPLRNHIHMLLRPLIVLHMPAKAAASMKDGDERLNPKGAVAEVLSVK